MDSSCNHSTDDSTPSHRDKPIKEDLCADNSSVTVPSTKNHSKGQALFLNFSSDLSPQKMNKAPKKCKRQAAYRVNGVNILNRNNLDSKTVIERIQKRRENHNHVERRRRDNINSTILELSQIVPNALQPNQKPNKGNILKLTLDYVKKLQADNISLKNRYNSTNYFSPNITELETEGGCNPKSIQSAPSSPIIASKPRTAVDTDFQQNIQSVSLPNSPMLHHYSHHCQQHHHKEDGQRPNMLQLTTGSSPLAPKMVDPLNSKFVSSMSEASASGIFKQRLNSAQQTAINPQAIPPQPSNSLYHHHPTLRPLLPASPSSTTPHHTHISNNYSTQARMSGTEKIIKSLEMTGVLNTAHGTLRTITVLSLFDIASSLTTIIRPVCMLGWLVTGHIPEFEPLFARSFGF
ncbi:hypothetical protein [Absidia glauca]|uniref:BHLH domain-containing protein n=1 Tax=Absidia glauca TaxID=4829 RepID=A0A163JZ70_ABSGL|nr:hypothetical protein [Absidia glauca]